LYPDFSTRPVLKPEENAATCFTGGKTKPLKSAPAPVAPGGYPVSHFIRPEAGSNSHRSMKAWRGCGKMDCPMRSQRPGAGR
jgi:chitodextrinase